VRAKSASPPDKNHDFTLGVESETFPPPLPYPLLIAQPCGTALIDIGTSRIPQAPRFVRRTILVSACEGRMHHKGHESSSRKLVWVEGQNVAGWGCSECAWVFSPSGTDKPLDEAIRNAQEQLVDQFASHACAAHPKVGAAKHGS
jgi:hypothetical protein